MYKRQASLAVLFETLPVLRGGVGNVIWFFLWTALLVAGVGPAVSRGDSLTRADYFHDFSGLPTMVVQMRTELLKVDPGFQDSISLSIGGKPPQHRFVWTGIRWDSVQVAARLTWFAYAIAAALLASLFFHLSLIHI